VLDLICSDLSVHFHLARGILRARHSDGPSILGGCHLLDAIPSADVLYREVRVRVLPQFLSAVWSSSSAPVNQGVERLLIGLLVDTILDLVVLPVRLIRRLEHQRGLTARAAAE